MTTTTATVQVAPEGLRIGDRVWPLYSGSVHYWRHRREDWPRLLQNVRLMGFHFLDTYFPWNVHETSPGKFDFGEIVPEKDIAAFLEACQDHDLFVLCRPGPHINSELPFFGYPERVVNDPEIQMRTALGAPAVLPVANIPIAAPSYASEKFYEAVAEYFDAVAPVLSRYIYPRGPIVAVQSDNEMSLFFRTRCYDLDYHPGAIAAYRRMLVRKYGDIGALNRLYGSGYADFDSVEPPRDYLAQSRAELIPYLDWAEYQEEYINDGLVRIRRMLEARGLTGVPYYHNYPTFYPEAPFRMGALEEVMDIAGVDAYPRPDQYGMVKRGAQFTSTMSRLPFIPEFGAGTWAWYKPQPPEDHLFNTRTAFIHGIRAINYYMLADRDRWLNTPLHEDGTPREDMFAIYQRWNAQLDQLCWHELRVERRVLILSPRLYARLRYVAVEGSIPYDWLMSFYCALPGDFFLSTSTPETRDAIQQQFQPWVDAFRFALDDLGVSYALADSDISDDRLAAYSTVIVPTFEWLDRELADKLDRYARGGGHVLCGPRLPTTTETGDPIAVWSSPPPLKTAPRVDLGPDLWLEDVDLWAQSEREGDGTASFVHTFAHGLGQIAVIAGVFPHPDLLREKEHSYRQIGPVLVPLLAAAGVATAYTRNNLNVDISVLSSANRRVICLANPTPDAQPVSVQVVNAASFRDIDTGARSIGNLNLTLTPWTVSIWEIDP
ncbi:MAG: beta-galactosidase [Chloroflexi bacterium]|nr:beta-galactosidase [Chloroflexota bacterium]